MKKISCGIVILALSALSFVAFAQTSIPIGSCGILYTYDAGGNLLTREYYCNNQVQALKAFKSEPVVEKQLSRSTNVFSPNPTSGKLNISFSKSIVNAQVQVFDLNGRILRNFVGNGFRLELDLSNFPSGVYFISIRENDSLIVQKIVKQ